MNEKRNPLAANFDENAPSFEHLPRIDIKNVAEQ